MLVGRCVLSAVDDGTKLQVVQVGLLARETREAERFQDYGFTSVPFAGAEGVALGVGGNRDHLLVIRVDDRRYRLKGLEDGEVAVYDDQGQVVKLGRNGIEISTPHDVTVHADGTARIEAQTAEVAADEVTVDATGDVAVTAGGNATVDAVDVTIEASGDATINAGGVVNLGGLGGQPVARQGDAITITPPEISGGSAKVFAA